MSFFGKSESHNRHFQNMVQKVTQAYDPFYLPHTQGQQAYDPLYLLRTQGQQAYDPLYLPRGDISLNGSKRDRSF